ncbi:MAG TPA: hypothetical protein PLV42_04455 [bacterium]|nr:hypothetical protein [bacterium]
MGALKIPLLSYLFFITVLFSTEFRTIFQTDGRTYYAVVFSLSFSDDPGDEKVAVPELLREDPVYLSIQEAMYIRNRLEEILDDEEPAEDGPDTPEEPVSDPSAPVPLGE